VFSAYDDAENKTICKNIVSLLPGKTTIFLTNDYNNVKNCDYILKLKKGKVSYFGDSASYNKLLKAGGLHE
jgi:ABC-type bacteriocin/lantibiotic exporter with double-glycine peptidase domain